MKKLFVLFGLLLSLSVGGAQAQTAPAVGNGASINGSSPQLSGLQVNSSTSAGSIKLGGTAASCIFNYGITAVSTLTFPCATTLAGATTISGGLTVTSNINGSGYAFNTGSSIYGATSALVNGPLTVNSNITTPGIFSTSGESLAADAATTAGWNFSTATGATYGYRFWNGVPGVGPETLQLTALGNLLINPNSNSTCIQINGNLNTNCPTFNNTGDGGLTVGFNAGSSTGVQFMSQTGSAATQEASINPNGALTLGIQSNNNDCLNVNATFSYNCPVLNNSSDGGLNLAWSSGSSLGLRMFTVNSSLGLTQVAKIDNSGNLTLAGTTSLGANQQGGSTPALNVNGDINVQRGTTNTGATFYGASAYEFYTGSAFQFYGGYLAGPGYILGTNAYGNPAITNNASVSVAGVSCQYFDFQNISVANLDCIDGSGNFGAAGGFYSASERRLKNNIKNLTGAEALKLALSTQAVRFCYKKENCKPGETRHIGFIADDTSTDLAPHHKSMDMEATAMVALAAVKYQNKTIQLLQSQVAEQKSDIENINERLNRGIPGLAQVNSDGTPQTKPSWIFIFFGIVVLVFIVLGVWKYRK